jgi:hypothetical protein
VIRSISAPSTTGLVTFGTNLAFKVLPYGVLGPLERIRSVVLELYAAEFGNQGASRFRTVSGVS